MPAVSQKQQRAMAIALKEPDKLYTENSGLKKMSSSSLKEFASTPRTGLPFKKKAKKGLGKIGSSPSTSSDSMPQDSSDMSR